MIDKEIKILDCTLRDGGYYNQWDFDISLVQKYLHSVKQAKIDIVELGFRFLHQKKFVLGPFAYSTDDFLNSLSLPSNISYAVMINASELIDYAKGIEAAVNLLFTDKKNSPVDIVRIATHFKELEQCKEIAKNLNKLGYRVFLNIMQITLLDSKTISEMSSDVRKWDLIEVLYFADSLGNMESESVSMIVDSISKEWVNEIGIHTHDNKNQALSNAMKAIESSVSFIDATILGMGRGAGNARMEDLLVEIVSKGHDKYNPDPIFPLVINDFSGLKKEYNWGPNIYYNLSAMYGIHPTYIQEMSGDQRYSSEQMLSAINFLKDVESSFYSFESMIRAIPRSLGDQNGDWSAKNWARNKDVLIIGAGPSTKLYIDEIIAYIERKNPIVLCLNINELIPEELVTAYVACIDWKIFSECSRYSNLQKPIILPLKNLPKELNKLLSNINILDYGLLVKDGEFDISDNGCVLDRELTITYALSIATASGAKRVLLTGIDGYEASNPKQIEMISRLDQYKNLSNAKPIYALTPTTYPIEDKSTYMYERFDQVN